MKHAILFNITSARSFHANATNSQPRHPRKDRNVSRVLLYPAALTTIAQSKMSEATHFTYQSIVYLGVALLKILLLFSISFG